MVKVTGNENVKNVLAHRLSS